jgi:hypothetical protein
VDIWQGRTVAEGLECGIRPGLKPRDGVPFSLVCLECDAGMEIDSHDQAMADGWAEIDYAPDLPMANFIGLCPECRERFEHWPAAD